MQKARKADREYASRATRSDTSDSGEDSGLEMEELDLNNEQDSSNPSGPVESRLRELPPPVGLAFGAYCEASSEVHRLVKVVASYMVEMHTMTGHV